MCIVWISEQTAIISLYSINWLAFITETECGYCAVLAGPITMMQVKFSAEGEPHSWISLQVIRNACETVILQDVKPLCSERVYYGWSRTGRGGGAVLVALSLRDVAWRRHYHPQHCGALTPLCFSFSVWRLLFFVASGKFHVTNLTPPSGQGPLSSLLRSEVFMRHRAGQRGLLRYICASYSWFVYLELVGAAVGCGGWVQKLRKLILTHSSQLKMERFEECCSMFARNISVYVPDQTVSQPISQGNNL
jgi:hypothetical protein